LTAERELFSRRAQALDATFVAPLAAFGPPPRAACATEVRRVLPALGPLAMRGHFSAACAAALFVVAALSRLGPASMSASMNDRAAALAADERTAGSGAIASYRGDGETLACVLGGASTRSGALPYAEDLATSSSSGNTRAEVLACGGRAAEGVIGGASCEPPKLVRRSGNDRCMGHIDLAFAFTVALTLATTQCSRAPDADDLAAPRPVASVPPSPPQAAATAVTATAAAAARVPSDVPSAVRVPIDGLPVLGSTRALVTVVAFTDYECPYCAKADKTIATLREALGDDVRVVLAMRPLAMHERAAPAARALLAAAEQGKAEAMHARLFAERGALDDAGLTASARATGLDLRSFEGARNGPPGLRGAAPRRPRPPPRPMPTSESGVRSTCSART
jgi:protein-disulfide isomerase